MTRLSLAIATITMMIAASPIFAVGTVNQAISPIGRDPGSNPDNRVHQLAINWTADASVGTVPVTTLNLGSFPAIQGMRLVSVEIKPGMPAPTNLYTITITDAAGVDLLGGTGANLSNTTATSTTITNLPAPVFGSLTFTLTGNAVNSATGSVFAYFAPLTQTTITTGAPSLTGSNTFTGTNTFTGPSTFSTNAAFGGPQPWIDVLAKGAKCDGVTDDTTPIQNAINATAAFEGGGTVILPAGSIGSQTGAACVVSSLNLTNINFLTLRGPGFGEGSTGGGTITATLKFTGTCNPNACLRMANSLGVVFRGVQLWFSGATQGPMIDLTGVTQDQFHGVGFLGPGNTIGPIIGMGANNFVLFDEWSQFKNASVFVSGPTTNGVFSDNIEFDDVIFQQAGTAAVQNPSIGWTFRESNFALAPTGTTCTPAIQYVGGYKSYTNISIIGTSFLAAGTSCSGATTAISFPVADGAGGACGNGGCGGISLFGDLFVGPSSSFANFNAISVGNNAGITVHGTVFQEVNTVFTWGTGNSVDIGQNTYAPITTFQSGTPANGRAIDNNGINQNYGQSTIATGNALTFTSGSQPAFAANSASLWSASSDFKLRYAVNNDTGGAASIVPRAGDANAWTGANTFTTAPTPAVAGATDLGTTVLPWGNLWLGTAATNNFKFQPASTTAARTIAIPDPGVNTNLALNLTATSAAFATATTAGTCVQNTTAVSGAATTMAVSVAPQSTPGVGAVWSGFVSSAGNVTINECAVATSAGGTIAFNIRVTP